MSIKGSLENRYNYTVKIMQQKKKLYERKEEI